MTQIVTEQVKNLQVRFVHHQKSDEHIYQEHGVDPSKRMEGIDIMLPNDGEVSLTMVEGVVVEAMYYPSQFENEGIQLNSHTLKEVLGISNFPFKFADRGLMRSYENHIPEDLIGKVKPYELN